MIIRRISIRTVEGLLSVVVDCVDAFGGGGSAMPGVAVSPASTGLANIMRNRITPRKDRGFILKYSFVWFAWD